MGTLTWSASFTETEASWCGRCVNTGCRDQRIKLSEADAWFAFLQLIVRRGGRELGPDEYRVEVERRVVVNALFFKNGVRLENLEFVPALHCLPAVKGYETKDVEREVTRFPVSLKPWQEVRVRFRVL